ncbi:MAG: NUDIX domain-containing protein [Bacteroidales bacterium]
MMEFKYQYPRMLVTVDSLVFLQNSNNTCTHILLIRRGNDPYKGRYAFPGGFPEMDELLVDAAKRELAEETGLTNVELFQLGAFDKIDRDPRDRNIAVAFYGFTTEKDSYIVAGDDADKAEWFPLESLPPLAFDHSEIILFARKKLGI